MPGTCWNWRAAKPWQEAIFRLVPLGLTAAATLLMIGLWPGTSAYVHKFLFGLLAYLGMVWLAAGWSDLRDACEILSR
jgi:hypothetical protein